MSNYGLEPGEYLLETSPWIPVDSADGRVPIAITPGSDEVVFDLSSPIREPWSCRCRCRLALASGYPPPGRLAPG